MRKFTCLFFLLFGFAVNADDITPYLKKVEGKTAGHSMRNVDFIYVINLDERPEKYEHCLNELQPYGINPFRFSAVNGWKLSTEDLNRIGVHFQPWMESGVCGTCYLPENNRQPQHEIVSQVGRTYFCYRMPFGSIGIVLSHLSVLQDAYDSGYETIWVMEDDIVVIRDPNTISSLIDKLDDVVGKNNWDILFTDRDTKNKKGEYVSCFSYAWRPNFKPENPERFAMRRNAGRYFFKLGARYGAYSMIIRRSGMKKILDFIKTNNIFLPYDMEFYLPNDIRLYAVKEDVVSTLPDALSDNAIQGYLSKFK